MDVNNEETEKIQEEEPRVTLGLIVLLCVIGLSCLAALIATGIRALKEMEMIDKVLEIKRQST